MDGGVSQPDGGRADGFVLHYHRAGPVDQATYSGWSVVLTGDVDATTVALTSIDDFGGAFEIPLSDGATSFSYQLTDGTTTDPATPVSVDLSMATEGGVWHWQNARQARLTPPPAVPADGQMLVYYLRDDGQYGEYGVYTWGSAAPLFSWPDRARVDGIDDELGAYYLIDLDGTSGDSCPFGDFCFIMQAGSDATKDPAVDRGLMTSEAGNQIFLKTADEGVFTCPERRSGCILGAGVVAIADARAHFVSTATIAWDVRSDEAVTFELRHSATADIEVVDNEVIGGEAIALTEASSGLAASIVSAKPHLGAFRAFELDAARRGDVPNLLRGQLIAVAYDSLGLVVEATQIQAAGAIDDAYRYDGPLGLDFSTSPTRARVWAPTAQNVRFEVFDANLDSVTTVDMIRDDATGVWSRELDAAWQGGYYRYEVTVYHPNSRQVETYSVTDPYSTSLSTNSTHTQIIDVMNDPSTKPAGWDNLVKPALDAPEDITIYELHVRDFSIEDPTVVQGDRGKFTAFLYNGTGGRALSNGMRHLIDLGDAGMTHIHLLPAFDIATIDEDPANRVEITDGFDRLCSLQPLVPTSLCDQHGTTVIRDVLATFGPAAMDAQEILGYMRDLDGFNWGYDPFHYSAPEGSYSTEPMGAQRVLEFRQMVQALADVGLRTALDVVYNHTNASGISDKSVLDRVVPWYYHRQDAVTGIVVKETCCEDTATEHRMMEKLMIDSVVFWAKAYKLDAFRFDLMGYHLKSHMVALRAALDALTVADDGIDGSDVYVYGEGWNPGGQGGSRGENATQLTLDDTGIGTFSDRLRDAARGGGPFDSGDAHVLEQGWLNGLAYDPNEPRDFNAELAPRNPSADATDHRVLADAVRVGLAGALRSYRFLDRTGFEKTGQTIPYGNAPAGYTSDPEEVVTYVEKHDNETLFDISNYKNPLSTSMADRVRVQNMGLSLVALSQGVPFFHAGMDLLRSKSMDRNSFNSGDWFNAMDWTGASTNFGRGLPQRPDNENNWPNQTIVLQTPAIAPTMSHTQAVASHMREMLTIRNSSLLFRLRTAEDVRRRVAYFNTGPDQILGLIVMGITDGTNCPNVVIDIDPSYDGVLVMFNANDEAQTFTISDVSGFELHPALAASADTIVQSASFDEATDTFSVPGRTTAVFVQPQGQTQGAGLPCNPYEL